MVTDIDDLSGSGEDSIPIVANMSANQQLDDSNAILTDSKIFTGKRVRKDKEILKEAIKQHAKKMKLKPTADHKNPTYSRHYFENLSLAEKVRL